MWKHAELFTVFDGVDVDLLAVVVLFGTYKSHLPVGLQCAHRTIGGLAGAANLLHDVSRSERVDITELAQYFEPDNALALVGRLVVLRGARLKKPALGTTHFTREDEVVYWGRQLARVAADLGGQLRK